MSEVDDLTIYADTDDIPVTIHVCLTYTMREQDAQELLDSVSQFDRFDPQPTLLSVRGNRGWQVSCDNGNLTGPFATRLEAETWALEGHVCDHDHKVGPHPWVTLAPHG